MSGATVWMHRADADLLMQLKTSRLHFETLDSVMREAGTPDPLRAAVLASYDRLMATFPALSPNCYLEDGAELDSWIGPLQVVWTPGHSPGLCCLYNPNYRYLFSSDHVIEDITPHVGWLAGEDMLGDYLTSLDRLDPLAVDLILPAHGAPFSGLRDWTAATREHHQGRTREIEQHQRDGLLLTDDLVRRLWPRELRPLDYQLALTEVSRAPGTRAPLISYLSLKESQDMVKFLLFCILAVLCWPLAPAGLGRLPHRVAASPAVPPRGPGRNGRVRTGGRDLPSTRQDRQSHRLTSPGKASATNRSTSPCASAVLMNNSCRAPEASAIPFHPFVTGTVMRIFTGPRASRTGLITPGMMLRISS